MAHEQITIFGSAAIIAIGVVGIGGAVALRKQSQIHIGAVMGGDTEIAGANISEEAHRARIAELQNQIATEQSKILDERAEHIRNFERRLNAGQKSNTYGVEFKNGKYTANRTIIGPVRALIDIPNE